MLSVIVFGAVLGNGDRALFLSIALSHRRLRPSVA
jgi:hypothetical protein